MADEMFKKTGGDGDGFATTAIVTGFESNKKEPNSSRNDKSSVYSPVKPTAATF